MSVNNDVKKAMSSRSKSWATIVYPESVRQDWREYLCQSGVKWCEGPIHDMDIDEGTGKRKKAHIHVILAFESLKTFEQVSDITLAIGAVHGQAVRSMRGAIRYLVHADNPDKHQYDKADIKVYNSFKLNGAFDSDIEIGKAERLRYIQEMMSYCEQNNIIRISDLMMVSAQKHFDTWFAVLANSGTTYILKTFIDGLWQERQEEIEKQNREMIIQMRKKKDKEC